MRDGAVATPTRLVAGVAGVVFLVALLNVTPDPIGVFFDDGIYLLVAKAIATGQGFVYPQLPGTPPAIHYPPAFPLLLAAVWKLAPPFPESTMWFKLVNPVLLGLGAAAAMRVTPRLLPWPPLAIAALVTLGFVSVPMLVLTSVLLSEPLFVLMSFVALMAALRLVDGRDTTEAALLAGFTCGLLILVRTVGGVLLPAVLLTLAMERRWRHAALYAAAAVVTVLPWQLFVWEHATGFPDLLRGSYGPYLEWVAGGYRDGGAALVLEVLAKNGRDAWSFLGIFFSPAVAALRPAAAIAAIAATLAGIGAGVLDRHVRVLALAVAAYLGVVFLWPYQIERFLWGAWPLLLIVAAYGCWSAWRFLSVGSRPRAAWGVAAVAAALAPGHATYTARGLTRGWAVSASSAMATRMRPAIQLATAEPRLRGRLIASDIAPALALYCGEQVISLDILRVRDHLRDKTLEERMDVITALDAAFTPAAYVLLPNGPILAAFLRAERDTTRHFREFTRAGVGVRAFQLSPR